MWTAARLWLDDLRRDLWYACARSRSRSGVHRCRRDHARPRHRRRDGGLQRRQHRAARAAALQGLRSAGADRRAGGRRATPARRRCAGPACRGPSSATGAKDQHVVGHGVRDHAADHADADVRGLRAFDRRARVAEHLRDARRPRPARPHARRRGRSRRLERRRHQHRRVAALLSGRSRHSRTHHHAQDAGAGSGIPRRHAADDRRRDAELRLPAAERRLLGADHRGFAGAPQARRPASSRACGTACPCRPRTDEANAIGEGLRPKPTSGPLSQPLPPGVRRFDVEAVKEQIVAAEPAGASRDRDRRRRRAADRVRERRQPAARARHRAPARDRGAPGHRRQPRAHPPAVHHREPGARDRGRRARRRRWRWVASTCSASSRRRTRRVRFNSRSAERCCRGCTRSPSTDACSASRSGSPRSPRCSSARAGVQDVADSITRR